MSGKVMAVVTGLAIGVAAAPAVAQTPPSVQEAAPPAAPRPAPLRVQIDIRYQIGTMESVLEHAVEHGASVLRDRLQALALAPVQALLLDNARVRGYRLEGYGVFFDIDVPSLETTLLAAFRTLDQNGLGLQSAWNQIKQSIQAQAANDANLQQAMKRLELQVVPPGVPVATTAEVTGLRAASGSAASAPEPVAPAPQANDQILANPDEAYRAEVLQAVVDAMLDHGGALGVTADEWLAVGVRRNEIRPRIGLETNAQTFIARVRGADLNAFRAGQLSREDAIKRVELKVF